MGGVMNMKAAVSEKGQVTIPKPIREQLGLRPGGAVEFSAVEGRLVGRRGPAQDPVLAVTGIIKPLDVDRYLAETRGSAE